MVLVGIVVSAAHTSIAAAQEPRPERLWDAYPLDPGQEGAEPADPAPTPTPTAAPVRDLGVPERAAVSEDDSVGAVVLALIGGAALVVGLGAVVVARRRRRRATPARLAERKPPPAVTSAPAAPPDGAPAAAEEERADPPPSAVRFARARGWPAETRGAWTCEIDWKPGYIKSGFRAMAAPPGEVRRTAFGQSRPVRWTLMGDAEPPTEDMVEVLDELVIALTEDGWVRIGTGRHWYSQRFVWDGDGQPRPPAPLTSKEANG